MAMLLPDYYQRTTPDITADHPHQMRSMLVIRLHLTARAVIIKSARGHGHPVVTYRFVGRLNSSVNLPDLSAQAVRPFRQPPEKLPNRLFT
jgi:hypothetical protein